MSAFLDDLLKKMKTAPHVGIPPVTNPKLPSKVERDTAEYAARQKEMPNFHFGDVSSLGGLQNRIKNAPHPTPKYADQKFVNNDKELLEAIKADFQAYIKSASANGVL